MKHLVRLADWSRDDVNAVFKLADAYGKGKGPRTDGVAALFMPATSLRTRLTFERGADLMGLQAILFPPETLDKPESAANALKFFEWAYKSGDQTAAELDYVPMPESVKGVIAKSWGQIADSAGKPIALK